MDNGGDTIRNSRGTQAANRLEGKGRSGNNAFFEVCRPLGDYLNGGCRTRVNGVTRCSLSWGSFFLAVSPFTRLLNVPLWVMRLARKDSKRSLKVQRGSRLDQLA